MSRQEREAGNKPGKRETKEVGAGGTEMKPVTVGRNGVPGSSLPTCATSSGTALSPTLSLQPTSVPLHQGSPVSMWPSVSSGNLPALGVLGWGWGRRLHMRPTHHSADSSPDAQSPECHPPGNTRPQGPQEPMNHGSHNAGIKD